MLKSDSFNAGINEVFKPLQHFRILKIDKPMRSQRAICPACRYSSRSSEVKT